MPELEDDECECGICPKCKDTMWWCKGIAEIEENKNKVA
jgi:hypothetical protein